ncbi:hypothetical protein BYT27DRAFT_7087882, partial [Phlegmacium glaucopus]
TNHFPLNACLHQIIGKSNSKRCNSCWRQQREDITETVIHFLFECPSFDYERHSLDQMLGNRSRNLRAILSNKDRIKELLCYIGRTGQLKIPGDVPLPINPQ